MCPLHSPNKVKQLQNVARQNCHILPRVVHQNDTAVQPIEGGRNCKVCLLDRNSKQKKF